MSKNVIVIGAGPAGMTSAIFAARNGAKVTLLEHMDKPGKKLLITGNGKCNLTNIHFDNNCYNSDNEAFPYKVLASFGMSETMEFFNSIGIYTKEKKGYIYPLSEQASGVLNMFTLEMQKLGIKVKYNQEVTSVIPTTEGFDVITPSYTYKCDKVIMATGSKAASHTGSDGSGYKMLQELGHNIIKPQPALVALKANNKQFCTNAKGVRVDSSLDLYINNELVRTSRGELQITEYGISGIMVFEVSRHGIKALAEGKKVEVILDFLPNVSHKDLHNIIEKLLINNVSIEKSMSGILNENLSKALFSKMKDTNADKIVSLVKNFKLEITGYSDFDKAQVCQGGADTMEFCELSLESKKVQGLYVIGELLDVDGICGGYNIQWAVSTGALAGKSV